MKILLAPDKFKGSLSAEGVCEALSRGMLKAHPQLKIISRPLADGGDGSLAILDHYFELETHELEVSDPLGRPILAQYKMAEGAAYIEMSEASGLVLLQEAERDCMATTSYGTGELILDAIKKGAKDIYLFIGGSATNDGAMGIAAALGYRFLDEKGEALAPIGRNLLFVEEIDDKQLELALQELKVKVVCDVNNPFYGPEGAAYVYAAQKGADKDEIELLDEGLKNLSRVLKENDYPDIAEVPGAGAAGGVGGGSIAFLGAELMSGIQTFLEISKLEELLKEADLIISGEGKMDSQTIHGKVVSGVHGLAQTYEKPLIGVCGAAEQGVAEKLSLEAVYAVLDRSKSVEEAMSKAAEKLEEIGEEIMRNLLM
ncbi:MAG: glycerate kinase [Bacteroidota bacterium]